MPKFSGRRKEGEWKIAFPGNCDMMNGKVSENKEPEREVDMKNLHRIWSFLLCLVLLSNLGAAALATETEALDLSVRMEVPADTELPENDELFALFAQRELYGYHAAPFGREARETLHAAEKAI